MILLEDVSLGNGMKELKLTHEAFEKRINSMIKTKTLTDFELKRILLNTDIKFVPMNNNRILRLPNVSIVLPVYNDEDVVKSCLETLVCQTYQNVHEIIVVDDGSTDNSLKILKEFENMHPSVRVINSSHFGRSTARNIGLRDVKGEFVLFAESDAMYAPWYLEKAVELLMTKNVDTVMLQGSWVLNSSIISKCIMVLDQIKWGQIKAGKKKIESTWVYKTEIVRRFEGFNEKIESGEDKELFKRINSLDVKIGFGLGYNWFHPTPNSLKQYLQRIFNYQRKKVAQNQKRKKNFRLLFMIILLIVCVFVILLNLALLRNTTGILLNNLFYVLFTLLFLFYFIRLFQLLKERKSVSYKSYLFILPFLSILAIFPKIIGIILGKYGR